MITHITHLKWYSISHSQVAKFPALTKDEGEVDVVIVGAGIVGLNIAYELATHGECTTDL